MSLVTACMQAMRTGHNCVVVGSLALAAICRIWLVVFGNPPHDVQPYCCTAKLTAADCTPFTVATSGYFPSARLVGTWIAT